MTRLVAGAAALAVAFPALVGFDPYFLYVGAGAWLWAALATAWAVPALAGQVSFGQAAYFGVGGYTSALLAQRADVSPWIGVLAAASAGGAAGVPMGLAGGRVRGAYLALVTFVVVPGHFDRHLQERDRAAVALGDLGQGFRADHRVALHDDAFVGIQPPGLEQNVVGQGHLANVLQRRATFEQTHERRIDLALSDALVQRLQIPMHVALAGANRDRALHQRSRRELVDEARIDADD